MACLVAPAVTAVAISAIKKKVPKKYHVDWLILMLTGGTLMLLVDHIANGEIVPYFPFFTRSAQEIWPEIVRNGLPMVAVTFIAWSAIIFVENVLLKEKHAHRIKKGI